MRRAFTIPAGQGGFVLAVVLILVLIMSIVVLAVLQLWRMDTALAMRDEEAAQAFFLAESGLERGRAWIEAQDYVDDYAGTIYPFGEDPDTLAGGIYWVTIEPDSLNPTTYPKLYTISTVAVQGTRVRRLELVVSPQSFADYLYLTDSEGGGAGGPIWFAGPDRIEGRVHTNDQVHIWDDPTFVGRVTSAYGGPDDPDPSHNPMFMFYNLGSPVQSAAGSNPPYDEPVFEEGFQLGAESIDLPSSSVADFRDLALAGGICLTGDYEVIFARVDTATGLPMDGHVSYRDASSWWTDVSIDTTNGVMYVDGAVDICGGTIDGQLTIASTGGMTIQDDIICADSDEEGPLPGSDDVLGLVSNGDIVVADNEANGTDCVIHAHLIATDGSFTVQNYTHGDPRGTLTVWGGICQKERGPVGTGRREGDTMIIDSGYAKDYHYDTRFERMSPPGYDILLLTGQYRIMAWRDDGSWSTISTD